MQTHEPPMTTHMSTKGQVVIPRALRDALGLRSGMPLSVQRINGGIMLKPAKNEPHPIMALAGAFHKPGAKPMSDRQMRKLFMDHVVAMDEATKSSHKKSTKKKPKD
jgi:AbrB family looped-hinge helix DNA binding protein